MNEIMAQVNVEDQTAEMKMTAEPQEEDPRAAELAKNFSYDGYQVVRRELFAHQREPSVVIRRDSTTFNTACIEGLEDAVYIQILVNTDEQKMVVRRCGENDKDALRWCITKQDKRRSRKVMSRIFSQKMYELMGWDSKYRYKILGHKIVYEDEMIYIFDLTETETYLDVRKGKKAADETSEAAETAQDATAEETEPVKPVRTADTRKGYLPEEWRNSFGLPVEEHKRALEINLKDGYRSFTNTPAGDSAPLYR